MNHTTIHRLPLALLFLLILCFSLLSLTTPVGAQRASVYYPGPGDKWERRKPEQAGMDAALLAEAMEFAKRQVEPKSVAAVIAARQRQESHPEIIGPTKDRGPTNGLVLRHGYIVAEFGETERVDMTFSVTKSFLSAVAGLTFDRGLIKDVNDPVKKYVSDGGFDSPHNAKITWHHLLQQTNQWEGWLWDKPSAIDEPKGHTLREPGTFWNYNDVRVNRLSLALLRVWKKPLPQVLKDEIMNPIGASQTWQWNGYRNSEVVIDGKKINSVSGGGHWGGGMFINSRDMARFGYLFLRRGKWKDKQLVSEKWVGMMTTPCDIKADYGYLWWLKKWPGAAQTTFAARGAGGNVIWVDPDHDLVVVLRWATNHDEIFKRVMGAVVSTGK
jgi:CubicO group peptidase (beta-lactamase class C family)